MKIRIAAVITASAAVFLWYAQPLKSENLAATCVSTKAPRSEVIAACTSLIDAPDTPTEHRHLFLTERAWAHRCNGHYELAIADVDRALQLQPENPKTWVLRAQVHASNDNAAAALSDYDQAIEIAPELSDLHWKRANFLNDHGKKDEALAGYMRVLELSPDSDNAAYKAIEIHLLNKNYETAYTATVEAEKKWPEKKWVHGVLVRLHILYTGDAEAALKALSRMDDYAVVDSERYLLGHALVHLQIGDEAKGVQFVMDFSEQEMAKWVEEKCVLAKLKRQVLGQTAREKMRPFLSRALAFELMGRRDLARTEIHRMFEATSIDGKEHLSNLLSRNDNSVEAGTNQAENPNLDVLIEQYLDHTDLRIYWLPEPKV